MSHFARMNVARAVVAVLLVVAGATNAASQSNGRFEGGPPKVEMSDDGRTMKLLAPFAYVDGSERRWEAPTGTVTDGASIPRFFWTTIGGPFEGKFRNAAIIHDRYCDLKTRPSEETHKVFHEAMLTAGVGANQAWLMYQAVRQFGPSWQTPTPKPECIGADGKVDYAKCTENSAATRSISLPAKQVDKKSLEDFLKQMEPQADPADLARLRQEAQKLR